jgi:hypothetical protein
MEPRAVDVTRSVRTLVRKVIGVGRDAPAAPVTGTGGPADEHPFSRSSRLAGPALGERLEALERAGVRLFPHPFASALAIVSDCDKSQRSDFLGYRGLLVDEMGLDFGDSCRLMRRSVASRFHDGLCFLRHDGAIEPEDAPDDATADALAQAMEFCELLREAHLGHVDHYHFLSGSGPRFFLLRDGERDDEGRWTVAVPDAIETRSNRQRGRPGNFNFRGDWMPVRVIVVQPATGPVPAGTTVTARLRADGRLVPFTRAGWQDEADDVADGAGWRPRLMEGGPIPAGFNVDAADPVFVDEIDAVQIVPPAGAAPIDVAAVLLVNVDRPMLRSMLATVHDEYGFRPPVITDHGSRFLVNATSESRHAAANAERSRELPMAALSSVVTDGPLRCSVLGDDPASFAYLLPELRTDFGTRFVNPGGGSCEVGQQIDLLNAVVPATARDGSSVYVARRTTARLPDGDDGPHPLASDQGTRSFPLRLEAILDEQPHRAGAVYPMYTHIGNLSPKSDRADPYLPRETVERLQDRVLNVGGRTPPAGRVWFTRASTLYDYALMMRSIADHVRRDDPDTVHVSSWTDPVLGQRLPRTACQLHGVTFHVDDAARARVRLDGEAITDLVRNPPDETGRPSVTVVGAGPRHVVLDDVDLVTAAGYETTGGLTYAWRDDPHGAFRGRAYAELALPDGGVGTLTWTPPDLHPAGAQLVACAVRPDTPGVRCALRVKTDTGGVFVFGDEGAGLEGDAADARYAFAPLPPDEWTLRLAPLHDLAWRAGARAGGPLPTHRVRSISILVAGPAGSRLHLDRLEFIRPATTPPVDPAGRCVVGGRVVDARGRAVPGTTVALRYVHDGRSIHRTETVRERRGGYAFPGVPVGAVVEVEASIGGRTYHPTRGPRLDVWGHDMSIDVPVA